MATSSENPTARSTQVRSLAAGLALVVLGIAALFGTLTSGWTFAWLFSESGWPFIIIGVGLALFILMLALGREAVMLALPASIVSVVGGLLLVMNITDQWQTMAYAWALVAPAAVGLGFWIGGAWAGETLSIHIGQRLLVIGLALFVGFGLFFELVLNLSGFVAFDAARLLGPLVLIGCGLLLLVQMRLPHSR